MKSHPLLLLLQQASIPETLAQVLKVAVAIIRHINPSQTPVIETDQPLYTLAKKLQWKFNTSDFAEKLHVSRGAHLEDVVAQIKALSRREWCHDSFVKSDIINRSTTQSHLIQYHSYTPLYTEVGDCLEMLKRRAYSNYLEQLADCEMFVATTSSDGKMVKYVAEQEERLQTAFEDKTYNGKRRSALSKLW